MIKKLLLIIAVVITLAFCANFMDPDFGWHLRTGQMILSGNFPKIDPFSYTMPTFAYIDHSWLTDVFTAIVFPYIGYIGLSLLTSLVAFLALLTATRGKIVSPFFLLAAGIFISLISVRPLVFSWFLFSIVYLVISNKKSWEKLKFFLPLIFLVWVNIHGSFPLGLVLLFLFLLFRKIQKEKIYLADWLIFLICVTVSLFNPYGLNLWREVYSTIFSSNLHFSIMEWFPTPLIFNPQGVAIMVFSGFCLIYYRKKYSLAQQGILVSFLILSLSSVRNLPYFAIISLPVIFDGFTFFENDLPKDKISKKRYFKVKKILWLVCIVIFAVGLIISVRDTINLQEKNYYPVNAVTYLKNNLPEGQIFSNYNWGGYLIWKLPEKKVFIDGRMPSWQETVNAFNLYNKITSKRSDAQYYLGKYNIKTILWPVTDSSPNWIDSTWKVIYKDNISVVYQKG